MKTDEQPGTNPARLPETEDCPERAKEARPVNTDEQRQAINTITEKIIGCAYKVSNELGCGFLEKPYENALVHELRKSGLAVQQQHPIRIYYDGVVVGEYAADIVVDGTVILELKAVRTLDSIHKAQCMNYVRATGLPICLLLNFGTPKLQIKRIAGPRGPWQTLKSIMAFLVPFLGA